jgi:hypothetical protein
MVEVVGPVPPTPSGSYSVYLSGGVDGTVSMQQSGVVPFGANSILIRSNGYPLNPPGVVESGLAINGQPAPLTLIGAANSVWTYAAPVSQYAGMNTTLDFYCAQGYPQGSFNIQDISFSTQGVHEPSAMVLFWSGGLVLMAGFRSQQPTSQKEPISKM